MPVERPPARVVSPSCQCRDNRLRSTAEQQRQTDVETQTTTIAPTSARTVTAGGNESRPSAIPTAGVPDTHRAGPIPSASPRKCPLQSALIALVTEGAGTTRYHAPAAAPIGCHGPPS